MKYVGHMPRFIQRIETKIDMMQLPFNWRLALICWPIAVGLLALLIN